MPVDASNALLRWYIVDKRALPWRAADGESPDPYHVWLSEIMLQQTRVATVIPYYRRFLARWPDLASLAAADESEILREWAGLGYYSRARNLLACARRIVADHGGRFPAEERVLRALPGIGAYTAAAIAAIAFGRRAVVVDGNVERVVARLHRIAEPLPAARRAIHAATDALTPSAQCGDFAQAMMDLGATICTPLSPRCGACPLEPYCAAAQAGEAEKYPVRAARAPRPRRFGNAYWLQRDGKVLLVRRPARGLLAGTLGLPTGAWLEGEANGAVAAPCEGAPAAAAWQPAGSVDHVFTHFALHLRLFCSEAAAPDAAGLWWPVDRVAEAGLPSLFAKAAARGFEWSVSR